MIYIYIFAVARRRRSDDYLSVYLSVCLLSFYLFLFTRLYMYDVYIYIFAVARRRRSARSL